MEFDIAPANLFLEQLQKVALCNQIHGGTPDERDH